MKHLASRSARPGVFALCLVVFSLLLIAPAAFLSGGGKPNAAVQKGGTSGVTPSSAKPVVGQAVAFAVTPPVSSFGEAKPETNKESILLGKGAEDREVNELNEAPVKRSKGKVGDKPPQSVDRLVQKGAAVEPNIPSPTVNFDGVSSDDNLAAFGGRVLPPDTNGAVGPNHYIQTVNLLVGIYNKSGVLATPKVKMSSLFSSIGAPCSTRDDGDPMIVYDSLGDRWLISQFCTALQSGRTSQLIGISKTGDPTGQWFVYNFVMPNNKFNDYPHFGVWPDAYYMSDNQFNQAGTAFLGAGAFAFDRKKMLVGDPTATFLYFDIANIDPDAGGMLPTHLVGYVPPPVGLVNTFWEWRADEFGDPLDALRPYDFHADFATPANSTLTVRPDIPLSAFDARQPSGRGDIEQPSPGVNVDSISDRMMNLANYRVLPGGLHSYVINFNVNVSGVTPTSSSTYQTGIRWCEVRRSGSTFSLFQEGTYNHTPISGSTGENLWMGSVAQDNNGNIALGFSRSSTTVFPSISYAGRLTTDPAGQLSQGEADVIVGTGAQRSTTSRWGDYSAMTVDPTDDCTFWYTQEYYTAAGQAASTAGWSTRVGAFRFTQCTNAPTGTINGTITNCGNGQPIQNAVIMTPEGFFRQTNASGQFSMTVAPGTYNVMVTGPPGTGLSTCSQMVTVANGGTATVNCCLQPAPIIVSAGATLVSEACTPANGAVDPNEQVTVSFCVQNTGSANTTNLVGTLQNTGGVTGASGPQNYGVVAAGGPPVCRNFTFLATGTCGGTLTASIQCQDGANNLGTVTYTFTLGTLNTIFMESFDGVTAPALPAGWTTSFVNGAANCTPTGTCALGNNWTTSTTNTPPSSPNAAFHDDPTCVTDNYLVSAISIMTASAQMTFRNAFNLESTFDGGVLEVSSPNINAGAFTDVTNAAVGGSFVSGGYTGTISVNFFSPIVGRSAWTGLSGGTSAAPAYVTTTVNLGPNVNGQTINLRWRLASDCSLAASGTSGQWIDSISITGGFVCSTNCPAPACTGITCPANITKSNDPNQCGAVVTYNPPTPVGSGCGTITCSPASGSFFPVGTTTVTCTASAGPTCSFNVTVNDTQPPAITCPGNKTAVTTNITDPCTVVTFTTATSDNCPGVTVVCNPPSGSCFPVGCSTVTCTATDASGNTATCSFQVCVFNVCLQDDSNSQNRILFNTITGDYRFCCNGTTFTGRGKITAQGSTLTLEHNPIDRRVRASATGPSHNGNASLQSPPGKLRCNLTDSDTRNNTTCTTCR